MGPSWSVHRGPRESRAAVFLSAASVHNWADAVIPEAEALVPTREEERQELARLLALPEISRSANLVRLLSFICEKYFDGKADEIRESAIAVQALGRRKDGFDSQADPIVRVTARTLRKRLEDFYRNEGRGHPVHLVLPTGQYVPRFVRNEGVFEGRLPLLEADASGADASDPEHGAGRAARRARGSCRAGASRRPAAVPFRAHGPAPARAAPDSRARGRRRVPGQLLAGASNGAARGAGIEARPRLGHPRLERRVRRTPRHCSRRHRVDVRRRQQRGLGQQRARDLLRRDVRHPSVRPGELRTRSWTAAATWSSARSGRPADSGPRHGSRPTACASSSTAVSRRA